MKRNSFIITPIIIIFWVFFAMAAESADFEFDKKMLKDVEIMESRHFKNKADGIETDQYRLNRLERALFGHINDNLPIEDRMKKLKIASQKKMLAGTSLPHSIRISPTRIDNDSIQIVNDNDVGIIDGLMKVYAPQVYSRFKAKNERMIRYGN